MHNIIFQSMLCYIRLDVIVMYYNSNGSKK